MLLLEPRKFLKLFFLHISYSSRFLTQLEWLEWPDAEEVCVGKGAHLASIPDQVDLSLHINQSPNNLGIENPTQFQRK